MMLIEKYAYRGREFNIVKNENGYWGLDVNLFDENGKLVKRVNGLEGHLNKNVEAVKSSLKMMLDIEYHKSLGLSINEAILAVMEEAKG